MLEAGRGRLNTSSEGQINTSPAGTCGKGFLFSVFLESQGFNEKDFEVNVQINVKGQPSGGKEKGGRVKIHSKQVGDACKTRPRVR